MMASKKDFQRAYEFGEQAAMRGLTRDECPYRLQDMKAHWLRGWHDWHNTQSQDPLPDNPAVRDMLTKMKAMLK